MLDAARQFTIIAGYRFFDLENLKEVQSSLRSFCLSIDLVGTVLVSHEGINFYVSGTPESILKYKSYLHEQLK